MKCKEQQYGPQAGFIQYIVVVIFLLALIFLSQQPLLAPMGKKLYAKGVEQGGQFMAYAKGWLGANISPQINREVEKRGEEAKQEVEKQRDTLVKYLMRGAKNYISEMISQIPIIGIKKNSE